MGIEIHRVLCVAVAMASVAGASPVLAEAPPAETTAATSYRKNDNDDWKFYASVNPWFVFMDGDISVRSKDITADIDFDQVWDALHMALMADFEVQKGNIGLLTDISYAYLWKRTEGSLLTTRSDVYWVLFDFALYYEALSLDLGSGSLPPRLRLQPYFGGRYQHFSTDVELQPTSIKLDPSSDVAAPILGLRAFLDIDEHWNLSLVGDGGGFGVDGMESTWQAELLGGYRFRFKYTDLGVLVGYKAVGVDVDSESKDVSGDIIYHGPVLKVAFEF